MRVEKAENGWPDVPHPEDGDNVIDAHREQHAYVLAVCEEAKRRVDAEIARLRAEAAR